jgi:4-amino-4-deoxy-L-arabinose transferase-like glycosyltransferase
MMSPRQVLLLVLALFVAAWTLVPSLLHTALPLDVVESGSWGRELVPISYKHPNLPGLLIEASYRLTGQYGWPQYLLSALAGALTVWLIYLLGRRMLGEPAGMAGALLLLGCYYFTWPIPEFNHNVAQLPVWAGIALLLWSAVRDGRPWQWLLLGLVAGLGLYAKLSTLSVLFAGGVWMLADPTARARLREGWTWAGMLGFAAIAALLGWQAAAAGGGLVSFISTSGANGGGPAEFVGAQLLDLLPLLVVVGVAVALPRRRAESVVAAEDLSRVRRFLAIMLGLPLLSAVLASILTGAQAMWGAPMLNLAGLAIVAWLPRRFDGTAVRRVGIAAIVLVVLFPGLFAIRHLVSAETGASPLRTQWPQRQIAERFAAIWRHQAGVPLSVVGGNDWVAGLIALELSPRASVFYRLDPRLSPWITSGRALREGMLVVWPGREPPAYAVPLLEAHVAGVEQFAWSPAAAAKPIEIGYAVVPPQPVR